MKVLKVILLVLAALLIFVVVKTYTTDPEFDVSRTKTIDASIAQVWPHISSLQKADAWNPWMEIDPNTVKDFGGEDGTVGSWASWKSDHSDVGSGKQTITLIVPNERVESELSFVDWGGKPTGYTVVESVGEGKTKIIYGFKGKNEGFFSRAFASIMDMESMVGPKFEKALNNLEQVVTSSGGGAAVRDAKTYRGYTVNTVNRQEIVYIGKRDRIKMGAMEAFFPKTLQQSIEAVTRANLNIAGAPTGLYFEWNQEEQMTDLFIGIPIVGDSSVHLDGFTTFHVPSGKALHIKYMGSSAGSETAHYAMDDMVKENDIETGLVIEEYLVDESTEPDTSKWTTNIYYMIR